MPVLTAMQPGSEQSAAARIAALELSLERLTAGASEVRAELDAAKKQVVAEGAAAAESADAASVTAAAPAAGQQSGERSRSPKPLKDELAEVMARLRSTEKNVSDAAGLTMSQYEAPPHAGRTLWANLGNALKVAERQAQHSIDGSKWISLRLDGHGFSKHVRALRRRGVIEAKGFSELFAEVMQKACASLVNETHAWVGYTQSDEMTVLIPPARVIRGQQQVHLRGGRIQKTATLAASHVANVFNFHMSNLYRTGAAQMRAAELFTMPEGTPDIISTPSDALPFNLYAEFDCRVGSYDTMEEALALLMWRSYDSQINGVTDAVFQQKGVLDGAKGVASQDTVRKLQFLEVNGLLPLHPHQAYGTYFVRELTPHEGWNPTTQEVVHTVRSRIQQKPPRCLINAILEGALQYSDPRVVDKQVEAQDGENRAAPQEPS